MPEALERYGTTTRTVLESIEPRTPVLELRALRHYVNIQSRSVSNGEVIISVNSSVIVHDRDVHLHVDQFLHKPNKNHPSTPTCMTARLAVHWNLFYDGSSLVSMTMHQ